MKISKNNFFKISLAFSLFLLISFPLHYVWAAEVAVDATGKEKDLIEEFIRAVPETGWLIGGTAPKIVVPKDEWRKKAAGEYRSGLVLMRPIIGFLDALSRGFSSGKKYFLGTLFHEIVGHGFYAKEESYIGDFWTGLFEEAQFFLDNAKTGKRAYFFDKLMPSDYGYVGGSFEYAAEWARLYGENSLDFYNKAVENERLGKSSFDKFLAKGVESEESFRPQSIALQAFSYYARKFSYTGLGGQLCTKIFEIKGGDKISVASAIMELDGDDLVRDFRVAKCENRVISVVSRGAQPVTVFAKDLESGKDSVAVNLILRSESSFYDGRYNMRFNRSDAESDSLLDIVSVDFPSEVNIVSNKESLVSISARLELRKKSIPTATNVLPFTISFTSIDNPEIEDKFSGSFLLVSSIAQSGYDLEPLPISENVFSDLTRVLLPDEGSVSFKFVAGVRNNSKSADPDAITKNFLVIWRLKDAKENIIETREMNMPGLVPGENTLVPGEEFAISDATTKSERIASNKFRASRFELSVSAKKIPPGVYKIEYEVDGSGVVGETNEFNNKVSREFVTYVGASTDESVSGSLGPEPVFAPLSSGTGARLFLNPKSGSDIKSAFDVDVMVDTRGQKISVVRALVFYDNKALGCNKATYEKSAFPLSALESVSCKENYVEVIVADPSGVSGSDLNVGTLHFVPLRRGEATLNFDLDGSFASEVILYGDGGFLFLSDVEKGVYSVSEVDDGARGNVGIGSGDAKMFLSPAAWRSGGEFDVDVKLDTRGNSIQAISAYLTFDAKQLGVVSINTDGSPFDFSAKKEVRGSLIEISGAKIGGVVDGDSIFIGKIRFEALGSETTKVKFTDKSKAVLLRGDVGENVLGDMIDGVYDLSEKKVGADDDSRTRVLDLNGDGVIDIIDVSIVALSFGEDGEGLRGDVSDDKRVDITDLVMVGKYFGKSVR